MALFEKTDSEREKEPSLTEDEAIHLWQTIIQKTDPQKYDVILTRAHDYQHEVLTVDVEESGSTNPRFDNRLLAQMSEVANQFSVSFSLTSKSSLRFTVRVARG